MKISSLLIATSILIGSTGLVLAQGATSAPPPGGGRMAACRDDMAKFCADKTGPDRRTCMDANKDKLSDGCKAAMAAPRPAPAGQ